MLYIIYYILYIINILYIICYIIFYIFTFRFYLFLSVEITYGGNDVKEYQFFKSIQFKSSTYTSYFQYQIGCTATWNSTSSSITLQLHHHSPTSRHYMTISANPIRTTSLLSRHKTISKIVCGIQAQDLPSLRYHRLYALISHLFFVNHIRKGNRTAASTTTEPQQQPNRNRTTTESQS